MNSIRTQTLSLPSNPHPVTDKYGVGFYGFHLKCTGRTAHNTGNKPAFVGCHKTIGHIDNDIEFREICVEGKVVKQITLHQKTKDKLPVSFLIGLDEWEFDIKGRMCVGCIFNMKLEDIGLDKVKEIQNLITIKRY